MIAVCVALTFITLLAIVRTAITLRMMVRWGQILYKKLNERLDDGYYLYVNTEEFNADLALFDLITFKTVLDLTVWTLAGAVSKNERAFNLLME